MKRMGMVICIKPERIAEVRTVLPSSSHTRFRSDPHPNLRFEPVAR